VSVRSDRTSKEPFGYCLNTSTIKGQGLGIVEEIEVAAKAGYAGIEPWVAELDAYVEKGGSLDDLGRRIADLGLSVENLIGFFEWVVDDPARRRAALEDARRILAMAQKIRCKRLAAPPMGAVNAPETRLADAAARYRELLLIGRNFGVIPMIEFWGVSRCLGRLGEAVHVAIESGERDACVLADIYHMYKSGSGHNGLRLLGPSTLGLVHVNDYPATPPRETITDAQRVHCGDGIAPWGTILRDLAAIGYRGMLSVELFNEAYWKQEALACARTALDKLRRVVQENLG